MRFAFWRASRGQPDPEKFFAELARTHPGRGNYAPIDRYRDFRGVFMSTDQGRRVLHEILGWGNMFRSSAHRADFDVNRAFYYEGERNVALRLLATLNAEPTQPPAQTTSIKPTE